jgi:2-succinyl-5-enolpyruvyl-6-hydroxy-3-cyclohexene-1-carboxylate synthase
VAQPSDPLFAYVGAFVDELWRAGLRHVVVCPGSRSTPLALAFAARQGDMHLWMHVDERSAAFFALGLAKRSGQPVAVVCTSGTAAANFFPAVVEAHLSHVPLVVLTTDRPPELRDNGAPQTIDQLRLYGTHAKWFAEIALPEATPAALRYIRTQADRAIATAAATPAGPVQLNLPFREPLVPVKGTETGHEGREGNEEHEGADNSINKHVSPVQPVPFVRVSEGAAGHGDPAVVRHLAEQCCQQQRGLIIVGAHKHQELPKHILALAEVLGYPVLADPLSGVRACVGPIAEQTVITSYDAFLRDADFVGSAPPEIILRFGAMPTAKPVLHYIQRYAGVPLIVIGDAGSWDEPTQLATEIMHTQPSAFCHDLIQAIRERQAAQRTTPQPSAWLARWGAANTATIAALRAGIAEFTDPFEGRVFTELAEILPDPATLFLSNSMPIRDCDTFFWGAPGVRIMGNRGANGIDGVISTALGISAAQADGPTVLVIGDLAFYHDMNGLLAAKLHKLNLTIVLVNNDGGGIFSFLSQADYPDHFEQLFGTPTGLDFRPAVEMYGGTYTQAADWDAFRTAIQGGIADAGLHVVEIRTDRTRNVAQHRELWQRVHTTLIERGVSPPEEVQG